MDLIILSINTTIALANLIMLFILLNATPSAQAKKRNPPSPKKKTQPKPKLKKVPSETSSEGGNFYTRQTGVQNRSADKVNDEILTPPEIARQQIDETRIIAEKYGASGVWMDGFKNTGVFYNNFPEGVDVDYCEIIEGRDFFKYQGSYDVICGNPPFSLLSSKKKYGFSGVWETVATQHRPTVISFITGAISISPQLIDRMNGWGYKLVRIHQFKVQKWVPSFYTIWVRTDEETETTFTSDNTMNAWVETCDEYHEFWEGVDASK